MASEVTVPGNTILELVEHWGSTPDHDTAAFITIDSISREKRQLSRKEVLDLSKRFAHKLSNYGIKKGNIVCNALPNSLERIVCEFGIHFSGAASMNGQILRSDGEDFIAALKTSQCTTVIADPTVPRGARFILRNIVPLGYEDCIESKDVPYLKRLIICRRDNVNKERDFIESLRNAELQQFRADVVPSDLATVMTTSGSTGYSKLVMHSHANICHFGKQVKAIEALPSGTRFINNAQLGWAGGYPQWYLSMGVTRYFIDVHDGPPLDVPAAIWKTMVEEKIDYGFLTPMHVSSILTSMWEVARWKPRILCVAGQPIKKGHLSAIGKLCTAMDVNYGMTECNLVSTYRVRFESHYVDGCAGFPGYGVKIKVVDADREEVPQGSTGEILVWSPSLCTGYLNNDSAKASFTSDGWLCTDDAGYIGKDGKLYIEGRQSDSISRGVFILYPAWLERKLREFPGVKEIVVVPVPDAVLHHEVCACVVVNGMRGVIAGGQQLTHSDDKKFQEAADEAASKDIPADTQGDDKFQEAANEAASKDIPADTYSDDKKFQEAAYEAACRDIPVDDTHSDDKKFQDAAYEAACRDIPVDDTHSDDKFQEAADKAASRDIPAVDTHSDDKLQEAADEAASRDIPADDTHSDDKFQEAANKAASEESKDIAAGEGSSQKTDPQIPDLIVLEQGLRNFADDLNLLHKTDAMRMVPKFYVFMDRFPMTSTGKLNRKEIRDIAVAALGLE